MARRPPNLRYVEYDNFRGQCETGMLALVTGKGLMANLIRSATASDYAHVVMLGWDCGHRVLLASESTTPESRTIPFSAIVAKNQGCVDVYRLTEARRGPVNMYRAWEFMLRAGGQDYPEMILIHDWLTITGIAERRHYPNSDDPTTRRVCSQLVHAALRVAGMDPIAKYDCDVYPGHFARADVGEYVGTLVFSVRGES